MILKTSSIKLFSGGFLNFNSNTIRNTRYWLEILIKSDEKNYDLIYKEILEYLELNPDMLDFNPINKNKMKYFINVKHNQSDKLESNQIPLSMSSKYYSKLVIFEYIGVKFYDSQTFENNIYEE
jgi:hypothetical protein